MVTSAWQPAAARGADGRRARPAASKVTSWQAATAPAAAPVPLPRRLHEAVTTALRDRRSRDAKPRLHRHRRKPDHYAAFQRAEIERWRRVAETADISLGWSCLLFAPKTPATSPNGGCSDDANRAGHARRHGRHSGGDHNGPARDALGAPVRARTAAPSAFTGGFAMVTAVPSVTASVTGPVGLIETSSHSAKSRRPCGANSEA